jgi:hypothetical protein
MNIFGPKTFAVTKYYSKLYHEWLRGVAHFVGFDCLLTVVTDLDRANDTSSVPTFVASVIFKLRKILGMRSATQLSVCG